MRFGPPNPLQSSLLLTGAGPSNGASFVGALDGYTTNMVELYSPFKKLLAEYTGDAVRVRRSSDNSLRWIPFLSTGEWDAADYLSFIGAGNGFAHTVPGQKNGRDQTQATAAAQPQIGVDGNGNYYLYAPGAGFTTTRMQCTGLSVACTDFTFWAVASAAAYAHAPIQTRDNGLAKERTIINYSSSIAPNFQDNTTGTVASIGSLGTSVYSTIWSAGSGGNKLSNRLSTTTGTRVPGACTINELNIGSNAGGATWAQNSRLYIAGLWSEDKGPTADFAALATLGKTLIPAAQ